VLTLIAVPVAYALFDDARQWLSRRRGKRTEPVDRGEAELAALLGRGGESPAE
jgi:hypothetical protein